MLPGEQLAVGAGKIRFILNRNSYSIEPFQEYFVQLFNALLAEQEQRFFILCEVLSYSIHSS